MRRLAVALLACAGLLATAALGAAPSSGAELAPRVFGGTMAAGHPGAVAIAMREGGQWTGECTGALWRPRILITAAHCVTVSGSGAIVGGFAVFPPGARALVYANTGPVGASPAQVIGVYKAADYVEADSTVDPNDIALLVLDRDLAPTPYARLATGTELRRWVAQGAMIDHVGYGLTGVNQPSADPYSVSLALTAFSSSSSLGPVFTTAQTMTQGVCPGDSGSPASRTEGTQVLLLGPMAGGNAPCSGMSSASNIGFAAMGYIPLLNEALAAVGSPAIPSPPTNVTVTGRNRDALVTWSAPEISPGTVVGYDVTDASGTVVCQSTTTSCTVKAMPDGDYRFWVRARNADGEGGSSVNPGAVKIAPPKPLPAPTIGTNAKGKTVIRFAGVGGASSAVATDYIVRTTKGTVLCRGMPRNPASTELTCTTMPTQPGRYRVQARAVTEMGTTPWSKPSVAFRVR